MKTIVRFIKAVMVTVQSFQEGLKAVRKIGYDIQNPDNVKFTVQRPENPEEFIIDDPFKEPKNNWLANIKRFFRRRKMHKLSAIMMKGFNDEASAILSLGIYAPQCDRILKAMANGKMSLTGEVYLNG